MTLEIKNFTSLGGGNVIEIALIIKAGDNSEKKYLKVLSSDFLAMRPEKGEISCELYDELEAADRRCDAYLKALNILSFGANTARTLTIKLRRRGIDEEVAREVVEILRDKGYLNEEEELLHEIERCIRKKWGKARIMAHLHSRGYEDEALLAAEDAFSEVDFEELCFERLCQKCDAVPSDPRERQRLVASLARYGYSMSEIKFALTKFNKM